MGVLSPKLASQAPVSEAAFCGFNPRRTAIIFGIEEHDVHPDVCGFQPQLTRHLEQHANPRSSVVRAIDGFADARAVFVCEGSGIPVRVEHDAVTRFRMEGPNDILHVQNGAVVGPCPSLLNEDLGSMPFQFSGQPFAACVVLRGVGNAWAKRDLPFDVGVCRVFVERRDFVRAGGRRGCVRRRRIP